MNMQYSPNIREPRCLGFRPFVMTHLVLLFRSFVTRADLTPCESTAPTPLLMRSSLSTQSSPACIK